jgi:hypothetical protein
MVLAASRLCIGCLRRCLASAEPGQTSGFWAQRIAALNVRPTLFYGPLRLYVSSPGAPRRRRRVVDPPARPVTRLSAGGEGGLDNGAAAPWPLASARRPRLKENWCCGSPACFGDCGVLPPSRPACLNPRWRAHPIAISRPTHWPETPSCAPEHL